MNYPQACNPNKEILICLLSSNITDELIPELSDKINEAAEKVKVLV